MNDLLYNLLCIDNFYGSLDCTVLGLIEIFNIKGIVALEIINKKDLICRNYNDVGASIIKRFNFDNRTILKILSNKDYIFINCSQTHRMIIGFDAIKDSENHKLFELYREMINRVVEALYKKMLREEYLTKKSFFDMLTGCYNRNYFEVKTKEYRNAIGIGIIVCDMDMLKYINDNLGHSYGDKIIKIFANRLKSIISEDDFIFRTGGDEFIILTENKNQTYLKSLVENIKFEFKMTEENNDFPVSVSVGYSCKDFTTQSLRECIKMADYHMYQHKLSHKERSKRIITKYVANSNIKKVGKFE